MAYVYYPAGNCGPSGILPTKNCSPCLIKEKSRIRAVALYKKASPFINMANPSEWDTKINQKNAIIIFGVTGSFTANDPEQLTGFGEQEFENGQATNEIIWRDPNVIQDNDFYTTLPKTNEWVVVFKTENYIWDTHNIASFKAKILITDNIKEVVVYEITASYPDNELPTPYLAPAGIFQPCAISYY